MDKTMAAVTVAAIMLASGAQAQDGREGGPFEIEKCQTISQPGSYKLVNNLTFSADTGACLQITVSSVTIDLVGFTISGPSNGSEAARNNSIGILASQERGIAVRNGSISGFGTGVDLGSGDGSIVEGLRVFGGGLPVQGGIFAVGIVKGNTVVGIMGLPGEGVGISATGIVTGNYVSGSRIAGFEIGQGSTVMSNTATTQSPDPGIGFEVDCPSNVTDNTAIGNNGLGRTLLLNGTGCNNTINVAP